MIDLKDACREYETQFGNYSQLEFKCEHCDQEFNNFVLHLSILLYGFSNFIHKDFFYSGITCPCCLKTNLLKGDDVEKFRNDVSTYIGDITSSVLKLRYHSGVLCSPCQYPELKKFQIPYVFIGLPENLYDVIYSYSSEAELDQKGYLCSFGYHDPLPIGANASVWWYRPDQIESLVELENEKGIKLFPRYVHAGSESFYDRYDKFCWNYKLDLEYLNYLKEEACENYEGLKEYAYEKNINLNRLLQDNSGILPVGCVETLIKQAQENSDKEILQLTSEFLNIVVNFDSAPLSERLGIGDFYKGWFKSVTPFKNRSIPTSYEELVKGKYTSKISNDDAMEMAEKVRPYITKTHVQDWAIKNHQNFINEYVSLACRTDFSYGHVWDLKCRYLKNLNKIRDKVSIKDSQYAMYQTGATWTIIFNGKEIGGLEQKGHKYIHFLIQRPNDSFLTIEMDNLISSPDKDDNENPDQELSVEDRADLFGHTPAKIKKLNLSEDEEESYIKRLEELREYRDVIKRYEATKEKELLMRFGLIDSLDENDNEDEIEPALLKEAKKAIGRFIKDYQNKLKFGKDIYEHKEMEKKSQGRISKAIERAVKEIEKYDYYAFKHLEIALRPFNSPIQGYGLSKKMKWMTR
jgi:hypothetical protein